MALVTHSNTSPCAYETCTMYMYIHTVGMQYTHHTHTHSLTAITCTGACLPEVVQPHQPPLLAGEELVRAVGSDSYLSGMREGREGQGEGVRQGGRKGGREGERGGYL